MNSPRHTHSRHPDINELCQTYAFKEWNPTQNYITALYFPHYILHTGRWNKILPQPNFLQGLIVDSPRKKTPDLIHLHLPSPRKKTPYLTWSTHEEFLWSLTRWKFVLNIHREENVFKLHTHSATEQWSQWIEVNWVLEDQ